MKIAENKEDIKIVYCPVMIVKVVMLNRVRSRLMIEDKLINNK